MTNSPRRYAMNYSWVWGPDNRDLDKTASLAMTLRDAPPGQFAPLLRDWLGSLQSDDATSGNYYEGGYGVWILDRDDRGARIIFTSGGQDVADSLGYGVEKFYEQVLQPLTEGAVTWTELPLETPRDTSGGTPLDPPLG
ncbi:hypothetical protein AL755_15000 [Arthrobacter sp. ERGS1:01]|uniref:hypothetical protein n=1 Tax=Arthrobacter sp. ERGS1:01 TaxID=1704044 RepID=UPI0006B52145|nr:hypothetical protein [Arthrobacter sp. ERGS1:01]ALE06463.1 hypothetical protein AL755_15000 [Arthrobacter sp. ERGS1:01]